MGIETLEEGCPLRAPTYKVKWDIHLNTCANFSTEHKKHNRTQNTEHKKYEKPRQDDTFKVHNA
jgi:hypothetical protein